MGAVWSLDWYGKRSAAPFYAGASSVSWRKVETDTDKKRLSCIKAVDSAWEMVASRVMAQKWQVLLYLSVTVNMISKVYLDFKIDLADLPIILDKI